MLTSESNIELDLEILVQESSQSNYRYVSPEPLVPCDKVSVHTTGSSWGKNNKTLMYFYLLCFIDLLYFIAVLGKQSNKEIVLNSVCTSLIRAKP